MYQSSVVISVYKDVTALLSILYALSSQTIENFEVIVSEDGCSSEMSTALAGQTLISKHRVLHLSQEDRGFRKNRALNNAICKSRSAHIIFIDGDCIPSTKFVSAHQFLSKGAFVTSGRRLELGPVMSEKLRREPREINRLSDRWGYFFSIPRLLLDHGKNVESGLHSEFLHLCRSKKPTPLLGCNFSCPKDQLETVNGFNEDYEQPGIGEDTDLQWRLEAAGFRIVDAKFQANIFHLHHERSYGLSPENVRIFENTKREHLVVSRRGLSSHQDRQSLSAFERR